MPPEDLKQELSSLANKYDNIDVKSAEWADGKLNMMLSVKGQEQIADLPQGVEVVSADKYTVGNMLGSVDEIAHLNRITVDPLSRFDLDLVKTSVLQSPPQELYARAIAYYKTKDVFGTAVNVLTNFASKGFKNDTDDPDVKNFFDNWKIDVGFDNIVENVFFDFFRVGMVRTYKIIGKYEPKINYLNSIPGEKATVLSQKEYAAKKNRFSKSFIPIAYTILNPLYVDIKGSLMFGQTATFLKAKAGEELKKILELKPSERSEFHNKMISAMSADFKKAVLEGSDIPLDPNLVGEIDYRRMPYERYPVPRACRAFEPVEFKDELRKADYSTLDGITNYILKITVGNDNFPITKQEVLDRVGEMFSSVSKSYKVVWNHTLNVEKITTPEVGDILGQDKYLQVNGDITAALGVPRALLDGEGEASSANVELAIKSVIEEINYARRQVERWIYSEYRAVAQAMGFDHYPKVRFDDMALRDEIQMMSIVQGMVDRRIISYRTGQEKLGFDPDTEIGQMDTEQELVMSGVLGIIGSPYQQSKSSPSNVQETQRTPVGTPSEGRPAGKPAKTPKPKDNTKVKIAAAEDKSQTVFDILMELSVDELDNVFKSIKDHKTRNEEADLEPVKKPRRSKK